MFNHSKSNLIQELLSALWEMEEGGGGFCDITSSSHASI